MVRSSRRFPPPWTIEELNDTCFVVSDADGQKLRYFYFEEEQGEDRPPSDRYYFVCRSQLR
jgi:hypothetical protein